VEVEGGCIGYRGTGVETVVEVGILVLWVRLLNSIKYLKRIDLPASASSVLPAGLDMRCLWPALRRWDKKRGALIF
jgi:hypothetical protein